jgi:iron(III) transport system permease protein
MLAAFVLWPLALVVAHGAAHLPAALGRVGAPALVARSLALAATSAVLSAVLGSVVAYAVTRAAVPGWRVLSWLCLLPLFAPPFLASLGLVVLAGEGGPLASLVPSARLAGWPAIVVAQVVTFVPYAFLTVREALRRVPSATEEAAESLGASQPMILWRVTSRAIGPGFIAAIGIVFVLALGDFANPLVVGGGITVLASEIYGAAPTARGQAAAWRVLLAVPCALGYAVHRRLATPWSTPVEPVWSARRVPRPLRLGSQIVALVVAGAIGCLWAGAATGGRGGYADLLDRHGARPLLATLELAVAVAVVGSLAGLGLGYAAARGTGTTASAVATLSRLPRALPGPLVAVGYLLAFGDAPRLLGGAFGLTVASVVAWKLPGAVDEVAAGLRAERALTEAARSLGGGPIHVFARITLPSLIGPGTGVLVGLVLESVVTVGTVAILAPPATAPATAGMLEAIGRGDTGGAATLGVVLSAATILVALIGRRAGRGREWPLDGRAPQAG